MKSKSFLCIASLAVALAIPVSAQAQVQSDSHSRYRVIRLSGLGGASSSGNTINNRGWMMGNSDLAGGAITHATLWLHGRPDDLGTLGGPSSSIAWPVKNNEGVIWGYRRWPTWIRLVRTGVAGSSFRRRFPAVTSVAASCGRTI